MNPLDDLADRLPPGPASQDLPRRDQHKADLLALMAAEQVRHLAWPAPRRAAARRWLLSASAAIAVVLVAVLAVLIPRVTGPAAPGAGPGGPAGTARPGPRLGSTLTSTRRWTVPAASLTTVKVITTAGQVTVTGAATRSATITAVPRYRGTAPTITSRLAGGTLIVTASCPQEPNCQVSLTVVLPAGLPVQAHSDQGDVRLSGLTDGAAASSDQGDITVSQLSGQLTATTDQGDINLTAVTGSLTAHTSQGTINAVGLAATTAALSSDQGDVTADFSVPPRLVTASSQEGTVYVRLPSTVSYDVVASSQLGSTQVSVPRAASSPHVVRATTQLGSVTVTG